MGLPVLILGQSGTGKSASLRNCSEKKFGVVNVAGKPLPFKNKLESITTDDYRKVKTTIKDYVAAGKTSIVVDDAQYLMANEFMRRATERGYDKFTEIAKNFWDIINTITELPEGVIVYFLSHIDRDQDGNEKIKTIGKLLDEKITVEGMFTIVLKTNVTDGVYSFLTQNNGHDTTKSPIGMFPSYAIDNDLNYVDEKIRNYYEIGEFLTDEDIKEIDEAAKKDDIPIADGKEKKRGRRSAKKEEPKETLVEEKEEETTEKPKRSRRTKEDMNNDDESAAQSTDVAEDAPKPKRTRRKAAAEERAAVQEENDHAVANANLDDSGEDIPFEESETPEVKEPPRRKRRTAGPAEEAEQPAETTEAPTRRRRRRA